MWTAWVAASGGTLPGGLLRARGRLAQALLILLADRCNAVLAVRSQDFDLLANVVLTSWFGHAVFLLLLLGAGRA